MLDSTMLDDVGSVWPGLKGPFIFYKGGAAGGIWEAPFKHRIEPPQLTNFFSHGPSSL